MPTFWALWTPSPKGASTWYVNMVRMRPSSSSMEVGLCMFWHIAHRKIMKRRLQFHVLPVYMRRRAARHTSFGLQFRSNAHERQAITQSTHAERWFIGRTVVRAEHGLDAVVHLAVDLPHPRCIRHQQLAAPQRDQPAVDLGVISACHFAVQLNHFIPGFLSYPVAIFVK